MVADSVGEQDLRAEDVDSIVKGIATRLFVGKELVMTTGSNAWSETFYQETATPLTAATGSNISVKGIPRLAAFPYGGPTWTKSTSYMLKHGLEGVISWEDARSDNIDVMARTLLRIAESVVKSVDDEIFSAITDSWTAASSVVNTKAIAAGYEWDSATIANRDPLQNVLDAVKEIQTYNYNPLSGDGFLALSPKDYANLLGNSNVRNAGQFYTDQVTRNGWVGRLLGLSVYVSNSITADYAIVGIKKLCATWKSAIPLTTATIPDEGIKYTIRAWELGTTQLTNPRAITLISNTQA